MKDTAFLALSLLTIGLYIAVLIDVYGGRLVERVRRLVKLVRVTWQQTEAEDKVVYGLLAVILTVYAAWVLWMGTLLEKGS